MGVLRADEAVELDSIDVVGKFEKTRQDAIIETKATSTREISRNNTKTLDDVVRSVPGAFTNLDKSSGSVSVNLRGQTGFGRVNTMIDGVSQTFYAASADEGGRAGGTSQFGANIDPAFIAGVDVQRGTFDGKGGGNSLMGSANFRTIGVSDIISDGRDYGFLFRGLAGNNAMGPNYMGALGLKHDFDNGARLGFMYAYSWQKISQDYEVGGGQKIGEQSDERAERQKDECRRSFNYWAPDYEENVKHCIASKETRPYDPSKLAHRPKSHLAKIEYIDDYNDLTLQYRTIDTALSGRKSENKNYQLNYTLDSQKSWDLNILASRNKGSQTYEPGVSVQGKEVKDTLVTKNESTTFDINLHNVAELPYDTTWELTFGINRLHNSYRKNRHPRELNRYFLKEDYNYNLLKRDYWFEEFAKEYNLKPGMEPPMEEYYAWWDKNRKETDANIYDICRVLSTPHTDVSSIATGDYRGYDICRFFGYRGNTFYPEGKQNFRTYYIDNTISHSIYTLNFNINKQKYYYEGPATARRPVSENLSHLSDEELEDYIHVPKYSVAPVMKNGSKTSTNYSFGFSAAFNELFTPFVNHSKTSRMPNIQEIFFAEFPHRDVGREFKMGYNELKPETARTTQFGINGFKEGFFHDDDFFGFKLLFYKTKIKNYIINANREMCKEEKFKNNFVCETIPDGQRMRPVPQRVIWINYDQYVNIKGFELELNYDIDWFYANLSYARQTTDQPASYSVSGARVDAVSVDDRYSQSYGLSKISTLPKDYASVDIGTRMFDKKLTVGTTLKYYGKSKRAKEGDTKFVKIIPEIDEDFKNRRTQLMIKEFEEIKSQPLILDFYVVFEPTKNLQIKGEIQNIFDKKYVNPLDANNDSASQSYYDIQKENISILNNYARGRTAVVSVSYKF